jgi:hypothetical protein
MGIDLPLHGWELSMTTPAEIPSLVDIHNLTPGSLIDVETRSRHYQIECLGGSAMRISGHPQYCPKPVEAELAGSVDSEGMSGSGCIVPGKHLVFLVGHHRPVTTSRVLSVHVDKRDPSHSVH